MTTQCQTTRMIAQPTGLSGVFKLLSVAHSAWRQRRVLERLDDAALHDIGISRAQAEAEASRPVWDVPAHWRR